MRQKYKRFLAFFMSLLIMISSVSGSAMTAFAASPEANISFWYASACEHGVVSEFNSSHSGQILYAMIDGQIGYCLNYGLTAETGELMKSDDEPSNTSLSNKQEKLLALCLYYGYADSADTQNEPSNTAGFPKLYTRDSFKTDEIEFPDGVSMDSLLNLDFYKAGNNVLMYGGTGTGKTMLSILIGIAACEQGIPVKFYRTAGLINLFSEAKAKKTLSVLKKKLNNLEILILDEFGYVPYDRSGAQLLFDYISEIHEQKSIILNTNLEFSQWVNVLYDQRMTTALIGRLTHHVELILFPGMNNRLRESSITEALSKINAQEASTNG